MAQVDLSAPDGGNTNVNSVGVDIDSDGYTNFFGTSAAAPHAAGAFALLMSALPEAPITDIIEVLKETARHPTGDQYRPDNRWGYGLVQPVEALKALA
jgi:subtilisin family serine protease